MTGLLFVLMAIVVTSLQEQINDILNIKFCFLACVMIIWVQVIFFGDLYMTQSKLKNDFKSYKKLNQQEIMAKYIERSGASCPTNV
jgi:hypothetical protein